MLKGENTVVFKHKRADLKIRKKAVGLDLRVCIWENPGLGALCVVKNPRINKNPWIEPEPHIGQRFYIN